MKRIFSSSQLIGDFAREGQEFETCATAEAQFDEEQSQLVIDLDSFVRPVSLLSKEAHLQAGWLPKKQSVKENVPPEEAPELA